MQDKKLTAISVLLHAVLAKFTAKILHVDIYLVVL